MAESSKIPIIAVEGPTASGKTALAAALCEAMGGEAVSCDSMQVYCGMPIATAQPTAAEMRGIPHHLIGFLPPDTPFSVVDYCEAARRCIADIHARGKLPVVVGGTGLYLNALLQNTRFSPNGASETLREVLREEAAKAGSAEILLERLRTIDPIAAEKLHPNDLGRIIRALEIWETTGETPTAHHARSLRESPYRSLVLGLAAKERETLYTRIDRRVDVMLESGLLEEARAFFAQPNAPTARQAIGYKELKPYLDGEIPLENAVEKLKQETRRYAKRQLTWLRREKDIKWLFLDSETDFAALTARACALAKDFLAQDTASGTNDS